MKEIDALLKRAENLHARGYHGFAISSAYYSMFYCARALLLSKGITPKSHAGVHAQLGKELVKTGEMPARLFTDYSKALNMRHTADYDVFVEYTEKEAEGVLKAAHEFLEFTKRYFSLEV